LPTAYFIVGVSVGAMLVVFLYHVVVSVFHWFVSNVGHSTQKSWVPKASSNWQSDMINTGEAPHYAASRSINRMLGGGL